MKTQGFIFILLASLGTITRAQTVTGEPAGIPRVPAVPLVVPLFAGQHDLLCVDHNDVITAIEERSKNGLVLASEDGGDPRRQLPKRTRAG